MAKPASSEDEDLTEEDLFDVDMEDMADAYGGPGYDAYDAPYEDMFDYGGVGLEDLLAEFGGEGEMDLMALLNELGIEDLSELLGGFGEFPDDEEVDDDLNPGVTLKDASAARGGAGADLEEEDWPGAGDL